jgi:uncharacterized protein (TIGR00251 family)
MALEEVGYSSNTTRGIYIACCASVVRSTAALQRIEFYLSSLSMTIPAFMRTSPEGVTVTVFVTPRAKRTRFVGFHGDTPKIALAAPPVDGKANDALVSFFRAALGIPKASIEIVRGDASRTKVVLVRGVEAVQVAALFRGSPE